MIAEIQFIEDIKESSLPIVKLTKSINGKTGTATFLFIYPDIFTKILSFPLGITSMSLIMGNKKINSKDIQIIFKDGAPFVLKSILILKDESEWFDFLTFMNLYSQETGLFFEYN